MVAISSEGRLCVITLNTITFSQFATRLGQIPKEDIEDMFGFVPQKISTIDKVIFLEPQAFTGGKLTEEGFETAVLLLLDQMNRR